jgi:hypothetical protein
MNQRIEELAEQCYVETGSEYTNHFAYWKFAELIVRECADIFEGIYTDQQRPERIDTRIKQHFGVEE